MKKIFALISTIIMFSLSAGATNWVQKTEDWAVDMDTIKYDGDVAKVYIRTDATVNPSVNIKTPNVKWVYHLESFERGTNEHLTLNEILYDADMQIIENTMNPYGFAPQTFDDNSSLRVIRDVLFK